MRLWTETMNFQGRKLTLGNYVKTHASKTMDLNIFKIWSTPQKMPAIGLHSVLDYRKIENSSIAKNTVLKPFWPVVAYEFPPEIFGFNPVNCVHI